ncbi:class I SAM-dependent methyltransferase [Thiohalocapsa marina]|uniref:Class I SAM-dependent methyltransferase n=1 Tax=Thiohalocapsa marina TaxID=424902 RepID=A0A5M8FQC3_9GAMM|nr:class I SAM-dependent methyltransferase [Thiohalocapsa marina]KAA6184675.1 class I SAM-dependent methyltransferase [Thiohalocapsa marina]
MTTMTDPEVRSLQRLMQMHSKHSDYQLLHPSLGALLGDLPQPVGKHEAQRQRYMAQRLSLRGLSLLDIGANTGYFSFAALEAGAARVVSQEGNAEHAHFIALAAQSLGVNDRLEVRPHYYSFTDPSAERFDVTLCLNVLHHLGDDFGDQTLSLDEAKAQMRFALNRLARHTRHLWMQLGFNWKGDRHRPLFAGGTKAELIDHVRQGVQGHWRIDDIAVVNPQTREHEPINDHNLQRFDSLGEFLNRPLFRLTSLHG